MFVVAYLDRYHEIIRYKRCHPFAAEVVRLCRCTIGGGEHEWCDACDRFPQPVLMLADGTLESIDTLRATYAGTMDPYQSAKFIGEARFRYLHDLELWAIHHNPAHPIANTKRKINPKRRRFLTDDYR